MNPLALADYGYFYVAGRYVDTPDGQVMAGQAYVEYWIPERVEHPYPLVLVPGGAQATQYYTATPDGRPGWASYFLGQGYAVYLCEQPARGRSAYHPDLDGGTIRLPADDIEHRMTRSNHYDDFPQGKLHTQWPGDGVPGDPIFDQFYASFLPTLKNAGEGERMNRVAVATLLDRIGPAVVQTHSQSGAHGWAIADERPALVKGIVAVEPSGPPCKGIKAIGPPDYFQDEGSKPYGLTNGPLTYAPAVSDPAELRFVRQDAPDGANLARCWSQAEPARQLPTLQGIPMLILSGEGSFHAPFDHCTSKYLRQAGVENDFVRLADVGITGNGHMMMLEKNSLEIAAFIAQWLRGKGL